MGGLKPSNFINVAGNINSSGGGSTPAANGFPQGPRLNNGTGALISSGQDFSGGGFFTGYWLTTGAPADGKTSSLSNGIFVGGWYSKTTEFSMTSGTSGVYVSPPQNPCINFAALAQANTNLIKTRNVSNEVTCSNSTNRVFFADCLTNSDSDYYKLTSGGEFKEYCDGTASLEMVVESINNPNQKFSFQVVYSGRTFTAPAGSPHVEGCTTSASSN
ncbi:MAG: hypothetical protein IPL08_14435 [Saprospiraceae bacterium]|nr:hypothetical protein [Saprospiraceae bacterium]